MTKISRKFQNTNMSAVKIADGTWVAFGHEVVNFGRVAVVLGVGPCGDLLVEGADGQWFAAPALCRAA